jgi:hypothetical protein
VDVVARIAAQVGDPGRLSAHLEVLHFERDEKTGGLDSLAAAHRLDALGVD